MWLFDNELLLNLDNATCIELYTTQDVSSVENEPLSYWYKILVHMNNGQSYQYGAPFDNSSEIAGTFYTLAQKVGATRLNVLDNKFEKLSSEKENKKMTYKEAKAYVEAHFPVNWDSTSCALIKLRHKAVMFPELGANGVERDSAQWMYIDGAGKIDTGEYGEVYYF